MKFKSLTLNSTCLLALLAAGWSLTGCATSTAVDRHFGMAVKNAQNAQTITHAPLDRATASAGTDAGIVRSSMVRYEKTFVTPSTPLSSLDQGLGTPSNTVPR